MPGSFAQELATDASAEVKSHMHRSDAFQTMSRNMKSTFESELANAAASKTTPQAHSNNSSIQIENTRSNMNQGDSSYL